LAPHLRQEERHIQDVNVVGKDVVLEAVAEHEDRVVRDGPADERLFHVLQIGRAGFANEPRTGSGAKRRLEILFTPFLVQPRSALVRVINSKINSTPSRTCRSRRSRTGRPAPGAATWPSRARRRRQKCAGGRYA